MRAGTAVVVLAASAAFSARAADKPTFEGAWDLRFSYKGQKPDSESARLTLVQADGAWSGTIAFERNFNENKQRLADVVVGGDTLTFGIAGQDLPMEAKLVGAGLTGKWTGTSYTGAKFEIPFTGVRAADDSQPRFDAGLSSDGFLPQAKAETLGMDGVALDELVRLAAKSDTDALLVVRDGKVVAERYFGRGGADKPLPAPTRFVAAFAAAMLVEDKKIADWDAPVSTWFPDWKEGRKGKATLRHLLTRTVGFDHVETSKLRASKDQTTLARGLPLAEVPGTTWRADDDASAALVSGVLGAAAGKPLDVYVFERLFTPLGIKKCEWKRDAAATTVGWDGLTMTARDLARVGRLVADDGEAGATKVISPASIAALSAPAAQQPTQGLLWELFVPFKDQPATGVVGTAAFGQWIVVFPKEQTVAVRLRARKNLKNETDDAKPEVLFADFAMKLANALR